MPNAPVLTSEHINFEVWIGYLEKLIQSRTMLSMHDFQDCCYRDWYDDGVSVWSAYEFFREKVVADDPTWAEVI